MRKWLIKGLALLNALEGIIHIIVAIIGFWGIVDTGMNDWRILIPPLENFIFGLFSVLTGYILGAGHRHIHNHKEGEDI
ncbi:hypothetical protein AXJ14_gp124 [Geobacillus virus E3]|uniref:hypothetical protein n=1 Tax=Geobacillus virus E3 TaxID=1572712 RepID=UPI000671A27B|nr:hypothetical protein AXJ14_gp124 [Geobacillus virus E3]AJA41443.1 hypothetical protein E3_0124 [Geobacillus virus E3]